MNELKLTTLSAASIVPEERPFRSIAPVVSGDYKAPSVIRSRREICEFCHREKPISFSWNPTWPGWLLTGMCTSAQEESDKQRTYLTQIWGDDIHHGEYYFINFRDRKHHRGFFDSLKSAADWILHMREKRFFNETDFFDALDRFASTKLSRSLIGPDTVAYYTNLDAELYSMFSFRRGTPITRNIVTHSIINGGHSMQPVRVKFYRKDQAFCIETTHVDLASFLAETARALSQMIEEHWVADEWDDLLAHWLPQIVEISSKLKGYKADVTAEQVIRAGVLPPTKDNAVWPKQTEPQNA